MPLLCMRAALVLPLGLPRLARLPALLLLLPLFILLLRLLFFRRRLSLLLLLLCKLPLHGAARVGLPPLARRSARRGIPACRGLALRLDEQQHAAGRRAGTCCPGRKEGSRSVASPAGMLPQPTHPHPLGGGHKHNADRRPPQC